MNKSKLAFWIGIVGVVLAVGYYLVGFITFRTTPLPKLTPIDYDPKAIKTTKNFESTEKKEEQTIFITSPSSGQTVGNPITIEGRADEPKNIFRLQIIDSSGRVLLTDKMEVSKPAEKGQFGEFQKTFIYQSTDTGKGTIVAYQSTGGTVKVPVVFRKK